MSGETCAIVVPKGLPNVITELQGLPIPKIQKIASERRLDASVITLGVERDINLGAMIRTAELCGINNVFIIGTTPSLKASMGAKYYVNVVSHNCSPDDDSIEFTLNKLLAQDPNYYPIYVEHGGTPSSRFDYSQIGDKHPVFIMGSEAKGFPTKILNKIDRKQILTLEQCGVGRSFNVGVACGIVLHNYYLQKTGLISSAKTIVNNTSCIKSYRFVFIVFAFIMCTCLLFYLKY